MDRSVKTDNQLHIKKIGFKNIINHINCFFITLKTNSLYQ